MEQGATSLRVSFRVGSEPGVRLGVSKPLCAGKAGGDVAQRGHRVRRRPAAWGLRWLTRTPTSAESVACHAPFQGLRGVTLRSSDGSPERQV